jgi:hypothetical protein
LTGSSSECIAGPLRLLAWSSASLTDEEIGLLQQRVNAFVSSIRLGLFPPAAQGSMSAAPPLTTSLWEGRPPFWGCMFRFQGELPHSALQVLHGMLSFFSDQHAHLRYYEVCRQGDDRNLLALPTDFLHMPYKELPFAIKDDNGYLDAACINARELVIHIEFCEQPAAACRDGLLDCIGQWEELVNGGYPPEGAVPGQSAVGASSMHFVDPYTIEYHAEGLFAHPACFEPLFNLACYWNRSGFPIARLELR